MFFPLSMSTWRLLIIWKMFLNICFTIYNPIFMFFSLSHFLNQYLYKQSLFLKTVFFPTSCFLETLLPKVIKEMSKDQWLVFSAHSSSPAFVFSGVRSSTVSVAAHTLICLFFCLLPCPLCQLFSVSLMQTFVKIQFPGPLLFYLFSFPC